MDVHVASEKDTSQVLSSPSTWRPVYPVNLQTTNASRKYFKPVTSESTSSLDSQEKKASASATVVESQQSFKEIATVATNSYCTKKDSKEADCCEHLGDSVSWRKFQVASLKEPSPEKNGIASWEKLLDTIDDEEQMDLDEGEDTGNSNLLESDDECPIFTGDVSEYVRKATDNASQSFHSPAFKNFRERCATEVEKERKFNSEDSDDDFIKKRSRKSLLPVPENNIGVRKLHGIRRESKETTFGGRRKYPGVFYRRNFLNRESLKEKFLQMKCRRCLSPRR